MTDKRTELGLAKLLCFPGEQLLVNLSLLWGAWVSPSGTAGEVQRVCVDHQAAGLKQGGSEAGKSQLGTDSFWNSDIRVSAPGQSRIGILLM